MKKDRFIEIDTLRAVGCLLVLVYHAIWQSNKIAGSGFWLYEILGPEGRGFGGFLLLFIISGYIIPGSLRGRRIDGLIRFGITRFFRLYPSFWIVLILGALAKYSTLFDKRFLLGITMVPNMVGVEVVLGHLWTLELTLIFYTLIAFLFLVFGELGLGVLFF